MLAAHTSMKMYNMVCKIVRRSQYPIKTFKKIKENI